MLVKLEKNTRDHLLKESKNKKHTHFEKSVKKVTLFSAKLSFKNLKRKASLLGCEILF